MEEREQEIMKTCENYASSSGFKLNDNKEFLNAIIKGLIKNEEHHGKLFCPCRPVTGNKEKDKKIVCPCIYHKEEIITDGKCHCSLFFKK